jgi:HSP20 family protein
MSLIKSRSAPLRASAFRFSPMPGFEEMENRMRKAFDATLFPYENGGLAEALGVIPPTDVVEVDDRLVVTTELPGLEKKDVEITVDEGVLSIRGEKLEERKAEEGKKYHVLERSYGSFMRSFVLPRGIDADKVTAEFDKGVLKVFLPKTAEAKVKGRKVEIGAK